MKLKRLPLLILPALVFVAPVLAHHSISGEFDTGKPVTINGVVSNVDWMNPHAYVFVDVNDSSLGKARTWACELANPSELVRRGFNRSALKVGMAVRVIGTRAKDGSFKIHTDLLSSDKSVLFAK